MVHLAARIRNRIDPEPITVTLTALAVLFAAGSLGISVRAERRATRTARADRRRSLSVASRKLKTISRDLRLLRRDTAVVFELLKTEAERQGFDLNTGGFLDRDFRPKFTAKELSIFNQKTRKISEYIARVNTEVSLLIPDLVELGVSDEKLSKNEIGMEVLQKKITENDPFVVVYEMILETAGEQDQFYDGLASELEAQLQELRRSDG